MKHLKYFPGKLKNKEEEEANRMGMEGL